MLRIIACGLLLAGCASLDPQFTRADASPDQRQRDMRECHFEAVRAGAGVFDPNSFIQGAQRASTERRVMQACMEARGYRVS